MPKTTSITFRLDADLIHALDAARAMPMGDMSRNRAGVYLLRLGLQAFTAAPPKPKKPRRGSR